MKYSRKVLQTQNQCQLREMRQPTPEVSKNPDDAQIRKSTLVFQPRESKVGKKKHLLVPRMVEYILAGPSKGWLMM